MTEYDAACPALLDSKVGGLCDIMRGAGYCDRDLRVDRERVNVESGTLMALGNRDCCRDNRVLAAAGYGDFVPAVRGDAGQPDVAEERVTASHCLRMHADCVKQRGQHKQVRGYGFVAEPGGYSGSDVRGDGGRDHVEEGRVVTRGNNDGGGNRDRGFVTGQRDRRSVMGSIVIESYHALNDDTAGDMVRRDGDVDQGLR